MCKNHDQLHYARAIRDIADRLADGDKEDRDLLLAMWAYNGACEFVERHSMCLPPRIRVKVSALGQAEHVRLRTLQAAEMVGRLHDRWDNIAAGQTPPDEQPVDNTDDEPPF